MYLYPELMALSADNRPIRVCLIGAGKFGSMFLSQVTSTPGIEIKIIADIFPDASKNACRRVGWTEQQIADTIFTDDAFTAITRSDVDIVIEATGQVPAGIQHARKAFESGKHIVMVNVEADALAGPLLAIEAASAGVVYSMAYGDQPALTTELVNWARSCGFEVIAAGKGTKYLPIYHSSTPDTVWDHYGLNADEASAAGMNSKMFNSFLDGTKSAIEMAAIANACDLTPPENGLQFLPCGMNDLAHVLKPINDGGSLSTKGQVEVVSSLERDGRPVFNDLRWGVYIVIKAPNDYSAACFQQYGMNTDKTGRYSAMFKPFHLIGLELNISILSAVLRGVPTGSTSNFKGDVIATAKRDLKMNEILDGEGGSTVWGKLIPSGRSLKEGKLPIGLANNVQLTKSIAKGEAISWDDVVIDMTDPTVKIRKDMEARFANVKRQ